MKTRYSRVNLFFSIVKGIKNNGKFHANSVIGLKSKQNKKKQYYIQVNNVTSGP